MNKNNSIKAIKKTNLTQLTKLRLSEIIGIEHFFYQEINQRKSYSKILSQYDIAFDYIDKILIVLNATSGEVSIIYLQGLLEHQLELQVKVLL